MNNVYIRRVRKRILGEVKEKENVVFDDFPTWASYGLHSCLSAIIKDITHSISKPPGSRNGIESFTALKGKKTIGYVESDGGKTKVNGISRSPVVLFVIEENEKRKITTSGLAR